jgi:hypothetical protein
MALPAFAAWMLEQEARALRTRLAGVRPFALQESMLPAANLLPGSQVAIEKFLGVGRSKLRRLLDEFLRWLRSTESAHSGAEEAQKRFTLLRLRFNSVLTQFDLFDNVITQRSENQTGVWLSGLDVASADALRLRETFFDPPPIICYLDRGTGAAIRRARTRLPGGGANPLAIIKVPRERMVGSGIASSLFHEVGHQAAALLGLVESVRPEVRRMSRENPEDAPAWQLWERWISEILADFWSVARVGVAATMGLMAVVSLPRPFVFRLDARDPHPMPWIRVKLSAAMGHVLYPQPAWERLVNLWESYYPPRSLDPDQHDILAMLEHTIPALVMLIIHHRPAALRGKTLVEVLDLEELWPARLRSHLQHWRSEPQDMYRARPIVVFATIGQGRADGKITPEEESTVLGKLLTHWALTSTLEAAAGCAAPQPPGDTFQRGIERDEPLSTTTRRTPWPSLKKPARVAFAAL